MQHSSRLASRVGEQALQGSRAAGQVWVELSRVTKLLWSFNRSRVGLSVHFSLAAYSQVAPAQIRAFRLAPTFVRPPFDLEPASHARHRARCWVRCSTQR